MGVIAPDMILSKRTGSFTKSSKGISRAVKAPRECIVFYKQMT